MNYQKTVFAAVGLMVAASIHSARAQSASEITADRAIQVAGEAVSRGLLDPKDVEVSVARSESDRNACLSMMQYARASNPDVRRVQELLKAKKYFTVIFWIVNPDLVGSDRCVFVDRATGEVITQAGF